MPLASTGRAWAALAHERGGWVSPVCVPGKVARVLPRARNGCRLTHTLFILFACLPIVAVFLWLHHWQPNATGSTSTSASGEIVIHQSWSEFGESMRTDACHLPATLRRSVQLVTAHSSSRPASFCDAVCRTDVPIV